MYSCTICHKTLLFLEQGSHKLNEASISLISEKYVHVKYILRLINLIQLTPEMPLMFGEKIGKQEINIPAINCPSLPTQTYLGLPHLNCH